MVKVVRIHTTGGPDVLSIEEQEVGDPGPGQVRLRQTAIGLNFIDAYHRSGLYPLPELPAVLGREAAGVVDAVGRGVVGLRPGSRVAYALEAGAYAECRLIDAEHLVPLPDDIDDRRAAGMMLKGLTAHYLVRRTHRVEPGETILLHAAAGGVGSIVSQWASHLGAMVIGTVGSREKADLAKAHGCARTILYREEDFVERVRELTEGRGVSVVYDSVGRDTFDRSLDCLAPLGLMVSFGQASGPIPPFPIGTLASKGSLFLTRPTLATYIAKREDLLAGAEALFDVVRRGAVRIDVRQTYPLADVARAHREMESRATTGSSVLIP